MKAKIRFNRVLPTALVVAGLMSVTAFSRNPNRTLGESGKIQSVNVPGQTLTIKEGKSKPLQIFSWDQDTRFMERDHFWSKNKPVSADLLQQGEAVKIRYQKENDRLVARTIVITHPTKAAASAS